MVHKLTMSDVTSEVSYTIQCKILTGKIFTDLTNFDNSSKFSSSIFLKNGAFKVLIRILLERGISSIFSSSIFQREVIRQNFPPSEFDAVWYMDASQLVSIKMIIYALH